MTIGSLFSGIGGLELGLERAGLGRVLWQVELSDFSRRVLARHWPEAVRHTDITTVEASNLVPVRLLCGGFPCQDVSPAASGWKRPGLSGARSGLWVHFARLIDGLRPETVVIENVGGSAIPLYLPTVRRDLYLLGYTSVAIRVSAASVGALHQRARVFTVAHAHSEGESVGAKHGEMARLPSDAESVRTGWPAEPDHARVVDGLPNKMDRNHAIGNSVCPQASEAVGRAIVSGWTRRACDDGSIALAV